MLTIASLYFPYLQKLANFIPSIQYTSNITKLYSIYPTNAFQTNNSNQYKIYDLFW